MRGFPLGCDSFRVAAGGAISACSPPPPLKLGECLRPFYVQGGEKGFTRPFGREMLLHRERPKRESCGLGVDLASCFRGGRTNAELGCAHLPPPGT